MYIENVFLITLPSQNCVLMVQQYQPLVNSRPRQPNYQSHLPHLVLCLPCLLLPFLGCQFCYFSCPSIIILSGAWRVLPMSTFFSNYNQDIFNLSLLFNPWWISSLSVHVIPNIIRSISLQDRDVCAAKQAVISTEFVRVIVYTYVGSSLRLPLLSLLSPICVATDHTKTHVCRLRIQRWQYIFFLFQRYMYIIDPNILASDSPPKIRQSPRQLLAACGREGSAVYCAIIREGEGSGAVGGGGGNGVGGGNSSPYGEGDAWISLAILLQLRCIHAFRPVKHQSVGGNCEEVLLSLLYHCNLLSQY